MFGKISTRLVGMDEYMYFITFVDDHTHHGWVYILKHKDETFQQFREWKSLVERSTGTHVKALRSDN